MPTDNDTQESRLMTRREVQARTGLGRTSIYRLMRQKPPQFPLPIKVSSMAVRWHSHEIEDWIAGKPRATGAAA